MSDTGALIIEMPDIPPALTDAQESTATTTETPDDKPDAQEEDAREKDAQGA